MSRSIPSRIPARLGLILVTVAALTGGCAFEPVESFDPSAPCTVDGAAPGAYPELESLLPETYEGEPPDRLDSGRNCTPENLGTLLDAGIDEVRFGGATWQFGGDIAVVAAVFDAPGLDAEVLTEFYRESARASGRTRITDESTVTIDGARGHRLDTTTGERIQTVVIWPSGSADRVNVVISHNLPDPKIQAAIEALSGA